jgi:hypothetical protein
VQSSAYPGLWILKSEGGVVLTMFYGDDGMVAAWTEEEAEGLVDLMASIFETRRLGEPQDMMGREIRDRKAGTIAIQQSEREQVLAEWVRVTAQWLVTPMTPAAYGALRAARDGDIMAYRERYQSGIGNLLHMAQCVRPDIAAPVGALATFSSAPPSTLYNALLDVVRYVASTNAPKCCCCDDKVNGRRSVSPDQIACLARAAARKHVNFACFRVCRHTSHANH